MNVTFVARARSRAVVSCAFAAAALLASSCATSTAPRRADKAAAGANRPVVWKISSTERVRPDGTVSSRVSYGYAADGALLSEETYGSGSALLSRKTYAPVADGSEEVVTFGATGDALVKAVRRYETGKLASETLYAPGGLAQSTEEYSYDSRGRRISRVVVPASGYGTASEYVYDGDALVRTIVRDSSGKVLRRFEITVTGGLPAREDEFDGAGNPVSSVRRTFVGGRLSREERLNASGALLSAYEYDRDESGNAVGTRYLDRDGNLLETVRTTWARFGETDGTMTKEGL